MQVIPVPTRRKISPLRDLISLCQLWAILRRLRPSVTNVSTPKAGLSGGLAAFLAGVPCRLYTLRGLRLETSSGMQHRLLLFAERLSCLCAHRVICVSNSLRQKVVALGLIKCERTAVFGSGSSNGVDVSRFEVDHEEYPQVREFRRKLRIPEDAPVVGFVGRSLVTRAYPNCWKPFRHCAPTFLSSGCYSWGTSKKATLRLHRSLRSSTGIQTSFVPDLFSTRCCTTT